MDFYEIIVLFILSWICERKKIYIFYKLFTAYAFLQKSPKLLSNCKFPKHFKILDVELRKLRVGSYTVAVKYIHILESSKTNLLTAFLIFS